MQVVVYGAYGYTGQLIVGQLISKGIRPLISGRDETKLTDMAKATGLPYKAVDLVDARAIDALLQGQKVLIHSAGPFIHTARPMIEACLRNRVHYLDITGEIDVFALAHTYHQQAVQAGVTLMPGVGFDVVPSDCLAAHVKRLMPQATHLEMAFYNTGRSSRGTMLTAIEGMGHGGRVRTNGQLVHVPDGHATRTINFQGHDRLCAAIPWGDVYTAHISTSIPNIVVYMAMPPALVRSLKMGRYLGWLLRTNWFKQRAAARVRAGQAGPTDAQRNEAKAYLWAEVTDADGHKISAQISTPEGYTLTARTTAIIAQKVLGGRFMAGYSTPSRTFGEELILEVEGVSEYFDQL